MGATELRRAAETLRRYAQAARPDRGRWVVQQNLPEHRDYEHQAQVMTDPKRKSYGFVASSVFVDDAFYIATLHPEVGLVLADWLDQCADRLDKGHHTGSRHSHRIAALINAEGVDRR